MTGYTVHTGSTAEFSDGWDRIFGKTTSSSKTATGAKKSSTTKAKTPDQPTGKLSKSALGKSSGKSAAKPKKKAQ